MSWNLDQEQELVEACIERIDDPFGFDAFESQSRGAGFCEHPLRLRGHIDRVNAVTGEIERSFDSDTMPDGVVLKACQNRRASVCQPCSAVYKTDARMLVATGLKGGKGVPESVASRPSCFVTLTAPSFGAVHRRPKAGSGPCRPGPRRVCPHGVPETCFVHHGADDDLVGEAICQKCYRYDRQVIWNALVTELWRRTTIAVSRELGKCCGLTEKEMNALVRLSYVKVVEYQLRGAIHLHVVVRVDGRDGPEEDPPSFVTTEVLTDAIRRGVRHAFVTFPVTLGERIAPVARWGEMLDCSPINSEDYARRVARYGAKYTTKSTHSSGALDHQLKARDIAKLKARGLTDHEVRLVTAAWRLGIKRELQSLRLRAHAHGFGYRGVCLTHSRRYSVTFTALRRARHEFRKERAGHPISAIEFSSWHYDGRGYVRPGDHLIARMLHASAASNRATYWECRGDDELG
ncbi:MAG: replication initiator [Acidimicrobiales bacterium]